MARNRTEEEFAALQANMAGKARGAQIVRPSAVELAPIKIKRKQSKYRNEPQQVGTEKYRSKKEMRRHQALLIEERAGIIENLRREVEFILADAVIIQGRKRPPLRYFCDFSYKHALQYVVEDCKGMRTEGYRIKRHLMMAIHGIAILET